MWQQVTFSNPSLGRNRNKGTNPLSFSRIPFSSVYTVRKTNLIPQEATNLADRIDPVQFWPGTSVAMTSGSNLKAASMDRRVAALSLFESQTSDRAANDVIHEKNRNGADDGHQ
jgi:hypothetical protein